MSCPKNKLYQYLAKELPAQEEKDIKFHLKECAKCQSILREQEEVLKLLQCLNVTRPSSKVRRTILEKARNDKSTRLRQLQTSFSHRRLFSLKRLSWGFAVIAVIVLFAFIFHPLEIIKDNSETFENHIGWQDDFFAQADWLNSELMRIESGALLTDIYSNQSYETYTDKERLSTMSDELIWLRGQISTISQKTY